MQGVMTSREAWTRFAIGLMQVAEMEPEEIAREADQMLIQYLRRFPDPGNRESAALEDGHLDFYLPDDVPEEEPLTEESDDSPSEAP